MKNESHIIVSKNYKSNVYVSKFITFKKDINNLILDFKPWRLV